MTMITPSYLGETIEYSSLHACRSTLEDPTTFSQPTPFTFRSSREINLLHRAHNHPLSLPTTQQAMRPCNLRLLTHLERVDSLHKGASGQFKPYLPPSVPVV